MNEGHSLMCKPFWLTGWLNRVQRVKSNRVSLMMNRTIILRIKIVINECMLTRDGFHCPNYIGWIYGWFPLGMGATILLLGSSSFRQRLSHFHQISFKFALDARWNTTIGILSFIFYIGKRRIKVLTWNESSWGIWESLDNQWMRSKEGTGCTKVGVEEIFSRDYSGW